MAAPPEWDFVVDRDDPQHGEIWPVPADLELAEGEVLLGIDALALTANNVTYATTGDRLGYWDVFPVRSDTGAARWGRLPAWGSATVLQSLGAGVDIGQRFFGFVPMSTHLVVQAVPTRNGFRDASPHRSTVNPVYNRYANVDGRSAVSIELEATLRPVFILSFVLAEHLREQQWFGGKQVVVTSASSKVGLGLGYLLTRETGVTVTGLTSSANLGFVEGTGLFDAVAAYDRLDDLVAGEPTMVIDVSGDPGLVGALRSRLGGRLVQLIAVGQTHWQPQDPSETAAGSGDRADGDFFFAPAHIQRLAGEWGPVVFEQRFGAELDGFSAAAQGWLTPTHHDGAAGMQAAYDSIVTGRIDPRTMTIVRPTGPVPVEG